MNIDIFVSWKKKKFWENLKNKYLKGHKIIYNLFLFICYIGKSELTFLIDQRGSWPIINQDMLGIWPLVSGSAWICQYRPGMVSKGQNRSGSIQAVKLSLSGSLIKNKAVLAGFEFWLSYVYGLFIYYIFVLTFIKIFIFQSFDLSWFIFVENIFIKAFFEKNLKILYTFAIKKRNYNKQ